jgi:CAAX protease family protein
LTAPAQSRIKRSLWPLWQIVKFYLNWFVGLLILGVAAQFAVGNAAIDTRQPLFQWVGLTSVVLATWIMLQWDEKLPWSTVGLGRSAASPRLLLIGLAWGGLTIGVASLALLGTHMLQIEPTQTSGWVAAAWHSLILLLPAAFFEELFIRGYAFAVVRRAAGWKTALITTSVVFGLLHGGNPGADAESILAVTVAGFFLGAIFLATRSLYAAGVAHFAWNWVMSGAMHIAVSGLPSPDPEYRIVETGPDWLTGGPWGPEGGLAAVAAMFAAIFYLYGRHLRQLESRA